MQWYIKKNSKILTPPLFINKFIYFLSEKRKDDGSTSSFLYPTRRVKCFSGFFNYYIIRKGDNIMKLDEPISLTPTVYRIVFSFFNVMFICNIYIFIIVEIINYSYMTRFYLIPQHYTWKIAAMLDLN